MEHSAAVQRAETEDHGRDVVLQQLSNTAGVTVSEPSPQAQFTTNVLHETLKMFPVQPHLVTGVQGPMVEVRKVNDAAVDVKVILGFRAHFNSQQMEGMLPERLQQGSASALQQPSSSACWSGQHGALVLAPGGHRSGPVITEHNDGSEDDTLPVRPSSIQCPPDNGDTAEGSAGQQQEQQHQQPTSAYAAPQAELPAAVCDSPFAALRHQPWSFSADKLSHSSQGDRQGQEQQQQQQQQQAGLKQADLDVAMADTVNEVVPAAGSGAPVVQPGGQLVAASPNLANSQWLLDSDRLTLGRRIAVGGFAEVFVGRYEGTLVAVKRLYATDHDTVACFVHEVCTLARLRHPNLILWMGYTLQPEPCIVTEFMARGSLYQMLRSRRAAGMAPEPRLAAAAASAVASGMAYLHSRSPPILHLDLKSPNILLDDKMRIKIGDFGLSVMQQHSFVSSGHAGGTAEWMAPEVLRCERYGCSADVYSYGVVLWELLTGQAPWEDMNPMQVVGAVGFAGRSLPEPTQGNPLLRSLCAACLSRDPAARPTFAAIVHALDEHFGNTSRWLEGCATSQPAHPLPPLAMLERSPVEAGANLAGGLPGLGLPAGVHQGQAPALLALPAPESSGKGAAGAAEPEPHAQDRFQSTGAAVQERQKQEWVQTEGQHKDSMDIDPAPVLPPLQTVDSCPAPPQIESPASRRRDRSPCSRVSSDDPPPIVARLADGGKSPRLSRPSAVPPLSLNVYSELRGSADGSYRRSPRMQGELGAPGSRSSMSGAVGSSHMGLPSAAGVQDLPSPKRWHRRTASASGSALYSQSPARAATALSPHGGAGGSSAQLLGPLVTQIPQPEQPEELSQLQQQQKQQQKQQKQQLQELQELPSVGWAAPSLSASAANAHAAFAKAAQPLVPVGAQLASSGPEMPGRGDGVPSLAKGSQGSGDRAGFASDAVPVPLPPSATVAHVAMPSPRSALTRSALTEAGLKIEQAGTAGAGAGAGAEAEVLPCSFSQWQSRPSHLLSHLKDRGDPLLRIMLPATSPAPRTSTAGEGEHSMLEPVEHAADVDELLVGDHEDLLRPVLVTAQSAPRNVPGARLDQPKEHTQDMPDQACEGPGSLSAWQQECSSLYQRRHAAAGGPLALLLPGGDGGAQSQQGRSPLTRSALIAPAATGAGTRVATAVALEDASASQQPGTAGLPPLAPDAHRQVREESSPGVPWVGRLLPSVSCQASHDGVGRPWFEVERGGCVGGRALEGHERGSSGGSTPASLSHWQRSPQPTPRHSILQEGAYASEAAGAGGATRLAHADAAGAGSIVASDGMDVCRPLASPDLTDTLQPLHPQLGCSTASVSVMGGQLALPQGTTYAQGTGLISPRPTYFDRKGVSGQAQGAQQGASAFELTLLPPCISASSAADQSCSAEPLALWPQRTGGTAKPRQPHSSSPFQAAAAQSGPDTRAGQGVGSAEAVHGTDGLAAECSSAGSWGMDMADDEEKGVGSPTATDFSSVLTPEIQHLMQQATAGANYRQGRFSITELSLPRRSGHNGSASIAAAVGGSGGGAPPCPAPSTRSDSDAGSMSLSPCSSMDQGGPMSARSARSAAATIGGPNTGAASGVTAAQDRCFSGGGSAASAGTAAVAASSLATGFDHGANGAVVRSKSTTVLFRKGRFFVSRTTTQQMVDEPDAGLESEGEHEASDPQQQQQQQGRLGETGSGPLTPRGPEDSPALAGHVLRVASSPSCFAGISSEQDHTQVQQQRQHGVSQGMQPAGLPPLPPGASPRPGGYPSQKQQRKRPSSAQAPPHDRQGMASAGMQEPQQQQQQPQERHYHAGRFDVHEVQQAPVRSMEGTGCGLGTAASAPLANTCTGVSCMEAETDIPHRHSTGAQAACGCVQHVMGPAAPAQAAAATPCAAIAAASSADATAAVQWQGVGHAAAAAATQPVLNRPAPQPQAPWPALAVPPTTSAGPKSPGTRVGRFLILDVPSNAGPEPMAIGSSTSTPSEAALSGGPSPVGALPLRTSNSEGGALAGVASAGAVTPTAAPKNMTSKGRFKVWES